MPNLADWYDEQLRGFNARENNFINNFNRLGFDMGMAAIGGIVKVFKMLGDFIWQAVQAGWEKIVDAGKSIGEAIKNGIETALETLNPFNWFDREDGKPKNKVQERVDKLTEDTIPDLPVWGEFESLKNAIENFSIRNKFKDAGSSLYTPNTPMPVEIVNPDSLKLFEGNVTPESNDNNWTPSGGVGGKVPEGGMLMSLFNPGMIWEGFLKRMNSYALASAGQASSGNTQSIERAISDGVMLMGDLIPTVTQLGTIIKTGIEKETPATVVKETAVETDNGVKDALTNFQTGFGEVINPLAEKLGNLDKVIQDKLGETDSAVLNLVKDLFSMMTGLVQSLANSNAELEVQLAGLDDAMSTAKNELVSSTEQVNQTLKNIQNGTNTAALKSPEQLTGLHQDKFNVEGAYTSLDALGDKSDETTNALDSFEAKLLTALSGVAETLNPLNIVTGWIGSLQSGLQGLISAIDPIAAIFRGINKALAPVLERLMKPLEHLGFLIGKALIPVVQFLAKVFEGVAYFIAGIWNALASVLNAVLGWLGVNLPMIDFGKSWEEEQQSQTPDEMTNSAGWHQPVNNNFNVTFTGNTILDTDDEAMETLVTKFMQYVKEHDIEVVT
jgi:hypothetical protein